MAIAIALMVRKSAGCPYKLTGMIALVLADNRFQLAWIKVVRNWINIHIDSVAPNRAIVSEVEMNENW